MPYIQLSDRRLTLGPGENRLPGNSAVVTLDGNGAASIKGESSTDVRVNGINLSGQPSPLLHGDKIEIGSESMVFADDSTGGSTQYLSRSNIADLLKAAGVEDEKPAAATGGRLVSLVDGREYAINASGFTMGRDPGCDVVVTSGQVSRNHADIELGASGYYIIDTSTNGVYVNNRRVEGTQTLSKGDVIRIAEEEFRFYSDEVSATPPPTPIVPTVPAQTVLATAQPKPQPTTDTSPSASIPAPRDATRVPVKKPEDKKSSGLSWWIWLLVAIILVAGVYFVIQGR